MRWRPMLLLVPIAASLATGAGAGRAPQALALGLAQFEIGPGGKVLPRPGPARAEILIERAGEWKVLSFEDRESNVFHKVMPFDPGKGGPGILTLGGSAAALKVWRPAGDSWRAETLWKGDFGGKFSRLRDAEPFPLGGGASGLAVATHDQGVVALFTPLDGSLALRELDRRPDTFVHEVEVGDLDGDGIPEIYATPSERNAFDGRVQRGSVVRYAPEREGARGVVVADLGDRHAKEILVDDLDGDGRDELYVSVEAVEGGRVEIRRHEAGTGPAAGEVIARLEDRLCRFLTAGDLDGDGKREIVAAAHKSGLWLLRPPAAAQGEWKLTSIDRSSSGFEHASVLADLDGDGTDELYVASDDQGEIRRYRWQAGRPIQSVIHRRAVPAAVFTWSLMPVPLALVERP